MAEEDCEEIAGIDGNDMGDGVGVIEGDGVGVFVGDDDAAIA